MEITSKEIFEAAYFEGKIWNFEKALQRRKVNPTLFFALLSSSDPQKHARAFAMIGIDRGV